MSFPTTLRIAVAEDERFPPLDELLDQWSAQTGCTVDVATRRPLAELLAHLDLTLVRYDLICAHSQYTAGLAPRLRPLDDLLSPGELADFARPAVEMCRAEGALVQIPRAVEPRLLYFRSDLFESQSERHWFSQASGGRELQVPQTWEELAAMAQYFTREGSMHGFAFPGREAGLVATFAEILGSQGGACFDADGRPAFLTEAGEWTLTLLRDLYARWSAVPPSSYHWRYEDVAIAFRRGELALACDFPASARLLGDPAVSTVAHWYSVALYPTGPGGRRAVWTGCPTYAIPAEAPNPEAALDLLRFLTGTEAQVGEARAGCMPSRISAFRQLQDELRDGTLAHRRLSLAAETLRTGLLAAPGVADYSEREERLWPYLQQAVTGDRSVHEALEEAHRAVSEGGA